MKLLEVLKMKSRIRLLRERKRMSQLMLGREIGVSQQIISRIENDISTLSIDLLVNLANYFNVTTDYILGISDLKRGLEGQLKENKCTRSIASTSKIKSRLTAALVINSFESRPADLVTTVTDHPERTGRYHPYVSESLLRDIRSNHTVLGCLPLLFPQCCR